MPQRRTLPIAALTCLLLSADTVPGDEIIQFISPVEGEIVLGQTDFRFRIGDRDPAINRLDVYVDGELIDSALPPDWRFRWQAPPGLKSVVIVAVAYDGQQVVAQARIQTSGASFGETLDISAVQLYPVVTDRRGHYVRGLGQSDFVVFDQGQEMQIDFFSEEPAALTIAIVLDVSRSMVGKLSFLQEASLGFVNRLNAGDRVSVYAFNNSLVEGPKATLDHEIVKAEIQRLTAGGGTALYDAVVRVLDNFEQIGGRKALLLFSDGRDVESLATMAIAVQKARRSEVVIFTIGASESEEDLLARRDLTALATETGGQAFFISKFGKLSHAFQSVLADLRAQYVLSYSPAVGTEGERSVEVRLRQRKYRVRCRDNYYYQPAKSK